MNGSFKIGHWQEIKVLRDLILPKHRLGLRHVSVKQAALPFINNNRCLCLKKISA